MRKNKVHLLFECSGTFKNEFKKLGYKAIDYDILNTYNETDNVVDLFEEIDKGFYRLNSIFDKMTSDDLVIAFFPCTRFEVQSLLLYRADNFGFKNWTDYHKLRNDLNLHKGLARNYEVITKLVCIALERNIKLIIENPYSTQHYLINYWCIKPSLIDNDRTILGDNYKKPTMYYFINCSPMNNDIEIIKTDKKSKKIIDETTKTRSLINPEYAYNFIRKYIEGIIDK